MISSDLQALITGVLVGAFMQASEFLDIDIATDADGNYLPHFTITGRQSGEKVLVEVHGDREYIAGITALREALKRD
jgi:hypothetical protein